MAAMRDLGLYDATPVDVKGVQVVPRDVFIAQVGPKLRTPGGTDLVALRVLVAGTKDGAAGHAPVRPAGLLRRRASASRR